ncbi:hypothetical protein BDV59DRAFT_124583 [Aspergillus ambiguus]|uniref:uncharacterized protein n=1 Tax=Aspergillus ambiguus TaxID=176160 RepID=UPI003CCE42F6
MATFETLPAELRIQILEEIPDVSSLRSLTRASPAYRSTYFRTRKTVLHQLVTRLYGFVDLAEPLAAVDSEGLHAETQGNKNEIIALLDRRRRHPELDGRDPRLPSEDQSVQLLQLYNELDRVLHACCAQVPRPSHIAPQTCGHDSTTNISFQEKARIIRSLCRLQTFCNIFGAREWVEPQPSVPDRALDPSLLKRRSTTWHRQFTIDEVWDLFFRTMPPWEVEEFGSVWTLIRQKYVDIFSTIAKEFPRNSPQWRALRPSTMPLDPSELFNNPANEYSISDYDDYCNHLVSLGPIFLAKVLQQPDEEHRRRLLACNAIPAKSSFMDMVRVVSQPLPLLPPADRYETHNIGGILPTLPPLDQPAQAWKQHWYGDASVDHVMYTPRSGPQHSLHSMHQGWDGNAGAFNAYTFGFSEGWIWGYALWDTDIRS